MLLSLCDNEDRKFNLSTIGILSIIFGACWLINYTIVHKINKTTQRIKPNFFNEKYLMIVYWVYIYFLACQSCFIGCLS